LRAHVLRRQLSRPIDLPAGRIAWHMRISIWVSTRVSGPDEYKEMARAGGRGQTEERNIAALAETEGFEPSIRMLTV
jgi:hypothetical protein